MRSSLGPTSLGLSELPGLPGGLFPMPDWGTITSLFFQRSFQFLVLPFSFWQPYALDLGTLKVVPEVPKPLLIFFEFLFFILFLLHIYFFLLLRIIHLSPFLSLQCWFPVYIFSFVFHFVDPFSFHLLPSSIISVSILIASVLNCASDRLAISSSLSCIFSGALTCSFIWAIFFFCLGAPVM